MKKIIFPILSLIGCILPLLTACNTDIEDNPVLHEAECIFTCTFGNSMKLYVHTLQSVHGCFGDVWTCLSDNATWGSS